MDKPRGVGQLPDSPSAPGRTVEFIVLNPLIFVHGGRAAKQCQHSKLAEVLFRRSLSVFFLWVGVGVKGILAFSGRPGVVKDWIFSSGMMNIRKVGKGGQTPPPSPNLLTPLNSTIMLKEVVAYLAFCCRSALAGTELLP